MLGEVQQLKVPKATVHLNARPGSGRTELKQRLAPSKASNIGQSSAMTGLLSSHPDAVRRRQQAEARRSVAAQEAQQAQSNEWWKGTVPLPSNLITASTPDAFAAAIAEDRLVVVDFFAPWCMACRRLFPALQRLAENNPDILFVKVNGGDTVLSKFVESLAVDKLPYFHFYRGGNLISQFAANLTKISLLRAEIAALKDSVLSNIYDASSSSSETYEERY